MLLPRRHCGGSNQVVWQNHFHFTPGLGLKPAIHFRFGLGSSTTLRSKYQKGLSRVILYICLVHKIIQNHVPADTGCKWHQGRWRNKIPILFPKCDRPLACMNQPLLNKCGKGSSPWERLWFYPREQSELRAHHSVPLEPLPGTVNTLKKLP